MQEALSWLKTQPVRPIVVEMDNLQVFNALHDRAEYANGFGTLINDCRALAQSLGDFAFSFVRRSTNTILLLGWDFFCQVQKSGNMFHLPG